jgi:hypothetical protein
MKFVTTATVTAAILLAPSARADAGPAVYPLSQVQVGQKGYGLTTFKGTTPERFSFEVVGIAKHFLPKMDIILVKSDDPKLQVSGFWQGMSGSPLYIDEKVACAFSYGFRFNKVALGGCTPIEYMIHEGLDALRRGEPALRGARSAQASPVRPASVASAAEWSQLVPDGNLQQAIGPARTPWRPKLGVPPLPATAPVDGGVLTASVPLTISGLSDPAFAEVARLLEGFGLTPMRGGGTAGGGADGPDHFVMGGSISAVLARGDVSMAATGTVSYIDGNKVLAFGHPLFQLGEWYMPVTSARVHGVVPSAQSAFVLATPAKELGSLAFDKQSMIMADTQLRSPMVPIDVYVTTTDRNGHRESGEFHSEVLHHRLITAPLANVIIGSAVGYYLPDRDHVTARIESKLRIRGFPALSFVDLVYSSEGGAGALGAPRGLRALNAVLNNPYVPVEVEGLETRVELRYDHDFGQIREIRLPSATLPPGRRSLVTVVMSTYDGKDLVEEVAVDVPESLAGSLAQLEIQPGDAAPPDAPPPVDLPTLLAAVRKLLPGTVWAASLYSGEGVAFDGKAVKDLPPGIADKLATSTRSSVLQPYRPVARTISPAKRPLMGSASLMVRIADK